MARNRTGTILATAVLLAACAVQAAGQTADAPYRVAPGLFDASQPDDLGLKPAPGTQSFTVFAPGPATDKFANGVALIGFRGKFYAQWQSSALHEDTPDTWVAYATSPDGEHWSAPETLVPRGSGPVMHTSGGWWTDGKTLVAYVNVWPEGFRKADGSHPGGYAEYRLSRDGVHWSAPKRVTGPDGTPVEGIIEQDPHALPASAKHPGRIVTAFHLRPGLIVAPFYTDDPMGLTGWTRGRMRNLAHEGDVSRELEPSWFRQASGCLAMIFRDENKSFRQLASQSCDEGVGWTVPALTNMTDSRAKQSAGNLPDGTAYFVNAPNASKVRIPLTLTLSRDGMLFDTAYLLRGRADIPPLKYHGTYQRPGFHYPKSAIWKDYLYVGYTVNKESVAVTRVPLAALQR